MSPISPAQRATGPWRSLLPVFAACAAIGLQAGVALPLVPLALERQGHDKLTIGVVAAAWAIGMLATASHIPRLAARFGAVPFIIAAVVAGSALTVAYTLTDSVVAWFVLTLLHGAVGGVPWVVSEIWMNVVVEEKRRGRVMGIYAAMVALGMALGPLVLQVVGVYGPVPFLAGAAHPGRCGKRLRGRGVAGAARHVCRLCLWLRRACRFRLPAGLCGGRRRAGRDWRALVVGLRHGQRRPAMADRLGSRPR